MGCRTGDAAEGIVYDDQCVVVSSVVPAWLVQRVNRERPLSCRSMLANAVRLQLHALAYNMANVLRTLALPGEIERWSMSSLHEKVVKIGAKVVTHARYTVFQMAEVMVPRDLFRRILEIIDGLRPRQLARC